MNGWISIKSGHSETAHDRQSNAHSRPTAYLALKHLSYKARVGRVASFMVEMRYDS